MVKKTISVLLVLIMVFTIMMPINVNGISKDYGGHWAEELYSHGLMTVMLLVILMVLLSQKVQ